MADNIQLGMSVEIQEAIQQITKFGDGVVQSVDEIKKQLDQRFKPADIIRPTIANLGAEFDGLNVSINDLLERLDDLRGYRNAASINSEAWHRWNREIQAVEEQLQKARSTINGTDGAIVKTGASVTNFTRYDLRLFASQVLYSSDITGRLGTQLSGLATGLLSGGFIGAAFAGFAALIHDITEESKEAIEQVKIFQDNVESLINIQATKGAFNIRAEDIPRAIELLKSNIRSPLELSQSLDIDEIKRRKKENAEIVSTNFSMYQSIKVLEDMQKKYAELESAKQILIKAGLIYTEETKTENEKIKEQKKEVEELIKSLAKLSGPSFRQIKAEHPFFEKLHPSSLGGAGITEQLREQNELLKEQGDLVKNIGLEASNAGESLINTWTSSIQVLRRNNSMIQQTINLLIQAAIRAAAVRAALFFAGIITNFFGGGIPAIATLATPSGGPSNPISLGGGNLGSTPINSRSSTITNVIQPVAVSVDGRIRGRDIYIANRNENNLRSKFT